MNLKKILDSILDSPRTTNVLLGIINMMLILGVFFLGFASAGWTSEQLKGYCEQYANATRMRPFDSSNFTIGVQNVS